MPINRLTRGTQIPIAPAETLYVPLSAVSFLGGFRTPAAEHAAPSLKRPASETLPNSGAIADTPQPPLRANAQSRCDRDRGEPRSSAPPTPPCVRVRTRRFEKLR